MLYVNLNVMDVNRSGLRTSKGRDVCNVIVHLHKVWRAGASLIMSKLQAAVRRKCEERNNLF